MVILSVVSAKGGVGKTTLVANLAQSIAKERNVFALDLDPQNALRLHFASGSREHDGVARAELGHRPWGSCIRQTQKPFVLPFGAVNDDEAEKFEKRLQDYPDRLMAELHALPLQASDLVIVDTPVGSSALLKSALRVSNYVLVVLQSDPASYATLPLIQERVRRHCAGHANFRGVIYLINNVFSGSKLSRDLMSVLRTQLKDDLIQDVIHKDESVNEALAFEKSVLEYAPGCEATADLLKVSVRLEKKLFPYVSDRARPVKIDSP